MRVTIEHANILQASTFESKKGNKLGRYLVCTADDAGWLLGRDWGDDPMNPEALQAGLADVSISANLNGIGSRNMGLFLEGVTA